MVKVPESGRSREYAPLPEVVVDPTPATDTTMPPPELPFGQAMTPETVWGIGTAEELKDQL
jgi:hypothetical protein